MLKVKGLLYKASRVRVKGLGLRVREGGQRSPQCGVVKVCHVMRTSFFSNFHWWPS